MQSAMSCTVPCDMLGDAGFCDPFPDMIVAGPRTRKGEYSLRQGFSGRRWTDEFKYHRTQRGHNAAVFAASGNLALLEFQHPCSEIHIGVFQFTHVAPAYACIKAEQERPPYVRLSALVRGNGESLHLVKRKYRLSQREAVHAHDNPLGRVFLHQTFLNGGGYHLFEHSEAVRRTVTDRYFLQVVSISRHHFRGEEVHPEKLGVATIFLNAGKEVYETPVGCTEGDLCRCGIDLIVAMFAEVAEEVRLLLFLQAVSLAVFEKFLLTLKAYFLGESECVLVLSPLCLCPGMQYKIQVQVFPFAVMLDFVFRPPGHCYLGIYDVVALVIEHGGLSTSEIVFQREAGASVFQDCLDEFRILFVLVFNFCHRLLF